MAGRVKLEVTIAGTTYATSTWRTIQQGRVLYQEWVRGFPGGMGERLFRSPERYQEAKLLDLTRQPWIRLPPVRSTVAIANLDTDLPVYHFLARDTNGKEYVYVLNGRYGYKVDLGLTVRITRDFGANSQCGRPALFEGNYYVPLGDTNDFQRLTAVGVDAGADTWDEPSAGDKALAFAVGSKNGTAQLARAHTTNLVDLSANGTDWTGDDHEVGDTSIAIVDMHYWRGEWAVVKQDGVWVFDASGNSYYIEQYTGRTDSSDDPDDGANSFGHGAYFYWAHRTGLWRFFGERGRPVGFDSDPEWDTPFTDVVGISSPTPKWNSVAAFGRWIYATYWRSLFQGYIRDDGSVVWHGALDVVASSSPARCFITEAASTEIFYLWLCEDGKLTQMRLETDGSTRMRISSSPGRGNVSTTNILRLPVFDWGMADKEKQLRRIWVYTAGTWTETTLQMGVYRNWATAANNVGSAIAAAGYNEVKWTPGTNDLAFVVQVALTFTTTGSYVVTHDPRVYGFGIQAATPSTLRAVIPLTVENIKTGQSVSTVHQALRDLLDGPRVAIVEPTLGGASDTWNGRITGYSEIAIKSSDSKGTGWEVTLDIERYDYGS